MFIPRIRRIVEYVYVRGKKEFCSQKELNVFLLFIAFQFNRLKEFEVWYDAATQIFFSLGVAYGSLIAFSSYNPIKNDSTRDAIIVCFINCATSIYASVVVFCFIGFQAQSKMDDCVDTQRAQLAEHLNKSAFVRDGQLTVTSDDLVYSQLLTNVSKLMNGTLVLCDKQKFLNQVSITAFILVVFYIK